MWFSFFISLDMNLFLCKTMFRRLKPDADAIKEIKRSFGDSERGSDYTDYYRLT